MDKKEFIFPGVVLGLVLVTAVGLLITQHSDSKTPLVAGPTVSSTSDVADVADAAAPSTTKTASAPSKAGSASTASAAPKYYYPYGTLTLSVNEVAGFKDGLSMRPVQIVEDSRCPADVECIQAGTVRVSLKTSINDLPAYQTVTLGKSVQIHGDTITLVSVAPARMKDSTPAEGAYRLTFKITPD